MKRAVLKRFFQITIWAMSVLMMGMALADTEVFSFKMVEAEKPEPIYYPDYNVIKQYTLDDEDVAILSKLLWSSPLRNETYKRQLLWVVFNRILDDSGKFGDYIDQIVTKSEFAFYDRKAHRSETNDRIAREELNLFENLLDGKAVDRVLPRGYIYTRFSGDRNQTLMCSQTIGGNPYVN